MGAKKKTFDQINRERKPRTKSEWIPIDGELISRITDLEQDIRVAELEDGKNGTTAASRVPRLRRDLEELQAEAEAAAVKFTATALPRKRYRKLIEAHPPKDPKRRWDDETFAPALISACITEPEGTDGDVIWNGDNWDEATANAIYSLCLLANEESPKVPFSVTSTVGTADSQTSSTSASATGED